MIPKRPTPDLYVTDHDVRVAVAALLGLLVGAAIAAGCAVLWGWC